MIQGITNFTEYFKEYENDYVVIGGLATAMVMNDLGFTARATKDIDLVVIAKDNEEFIKRLLSFIDMAGYKTKQKTIHDSKHNLFRFLDSENKDYPEQIELFAIHTSDSQIIKDSHIIPIQTPEYYDYLSAILLDTDYFNLLKQHTTNIEGLHVATPEVLIPLKIHAYLNLTKSKSQDSKKHLTDIVKLVTLLDEEENIILIAQPKNDFLEFLPILEGIEESRIKDILKNTGIGKIPKETIIELVKSVYVIK
jgi:hypothetical protein